MSVTFKKIITTAAIGAALLIERGCTKEASRVQGIVDGKVYNLEQEINGTNFFTKKVDDAELKASLDRDLLSYYKAKIESPYHQSGDEGERISYGIKAKYSESLGGNYVSHLLKKTLELSYMGVAAITVDGSYSIPHLKELNKLIDADAKSQKALPSEQQKGLSNYLGEYMSNNPNFSTSKGGKAR